MADNTKPTGKQKQVVDSKAFFSAPRDSEGKLSENIRETINEAEYFNTLSDKVRIVLGKNWDQRLNDGGKAEFKNDWERPKSFRDQPLYLEACPPEDQPPNDMTLSNLAEKKKFKLRYTGTKANADEKYPQVRLDQWTHYVKTGIVDATSGNEYHPIVKINRTFTDHYHETVTPYRIKELETIAAANAVSIDVKTYYNERLDSTDYEARTGTYITNAGSKAQPLQNALPNIYSFVKLLSNKDLMDNDVFDFDNLQKYMKFLYNAKADSDELKQVYKTLLKTYPLETLVSLYGSIGHTSKFKDEKSGLNFKNTKIIENIISNNTYSILPKNDFDGLFEDYFDEYTRILTNSLAFNAPDTSNPYRNRIQALENIMTNLVFSPDPDVLNFNVDQYKKYFPFYAELEFKTIKPANLSPVGAPANLADMMKQLYLTKFLSETVLMSLADYNFSWFKTSQLSNADDLDEKQNLPNYEFVDFVSDSDSSSLTTVDKKIVLLPGLIRDWTQLSLIPPQEGLYFNEQQPAVDGEFSEGDLRNYMTYFRSDFSEPINLNDDKNSIFVKIFGSAFLAKLLQTYKDNKRTYEDIINGVPAYTEDLFYRIEKVRIDPVTNEEKVVQNILMPNTSELNLAKYVDTQLNYATYATYRYNVYAHRVVFGSKYRYEWEPNGSIPVKRTLQTVTAPPVPLSLGTDTDPADIPSLTTIQYVDFGTPLGEQTGIALTETQSLKGNPRGDNSLINYFATFTVNVEPSIVLLEDKIFSTPEILILDKPPVVPDVNILPYRAVNNRLKILLSGAVDRYKQAPIIMLDSDVSEFDRIKRSQLVVDDLGNPLENGRVEFGSDDFVRRFQIFRTMTPPRSYRDFDLYQQINEEFFEESVLPNTKYYYTFRAIDDHGHVSNPTSVYEVELIDEKGAVKPVIRLYDMTPPKNKTNAKACQKYIYVKPTLQQLYFSDDSDVDSIFSQQAKKKKYKMRLTSKGSGKKIDINFSFRKEFKNS
jgi:hypothetical protein